MDNLPNHTIEITKECIECVHDYLVIHPFATVEEIADYTEFPKDEVTIAMLALKYVGLEKLHTQWEKAMVEANKKQN